MNEIERYEQRLTMLEYDLKQSRINAKATETGLRNKLAKAEDQLKIAVDALEQTVDEIKRDYAFKGKTAEEALQKIK